MKSIGIFLYSILFSTFAFGQSDPIEDYKTHKFPCDTGTTTLEITFCAGNKYDYADSLLNDTYKQIIKSIDNSIIDSKKELSIKQSKKNLSSEYKAEIQFLVTEIDNKRKLNEGITKSQKEWIKLRDMNSDIISITCEGGTECKALTILSEIDDTLDRITKLRTFYDVND